MQTKIWIDNAKEDVKASNIKAAAEVTGDREKW